MTPHQRIMRNASRGWGIKLSPEEVSALARSIGFEPEGWDAVRAYLNSLTVAEQAYFADRCGTTIGYLRTAIHRRPTSIDINTVIAMERESNGAIDGEQVRPDVDWQYLRTRSQIHSEGVDTVDADAALAS